jgi:hypothetical protein
VFLPTNFLVLVLLKIIFFCSLKTTKITENSLKLEKTEGAIRNGNKTRGQKQKKKRRKKEISSDYGI